MRGLRILLVDDQTLFVESLKKVLQSEGSLVGRIVVAANGDEAVRLVDRVHPDIVLMDVSMPGMDGIEATARIHEKHADVKIIMLSAFGYDDYVQKAIEKGAVGYVLKDVTPEDLIATIRAVYSGGSILPPRNVQSLLLGGRARAGSERETDDDGATGWMHLLSEKERRILLLISRGYSNREIGEKVHLGDQTVRNYVSRIYSKLGARDRFDAIRKAIEAPLEEWAADRSG